MALVRSLTFSLWTLLSNTFVKNIQLILSNHLTTTQKKEIKKKRNSTRNQRRKSRKIQKKNIFRTCNKIN